ncbi:MAG: hypothetical protein IGS39_01600 [Calothrix sp. C42_A2020_038]|nr:hypothetical protein [Calothrix sp. C42_A2020_038]
MYTRDNLDLFNFNLAQTVKTLKKQDKSLVEFCINNFCTLLGSDYTANIFTAAILELSEIDRDTFYWTLENFSHHNSCCHLLEAVTGLTVKKLLKAGFILGQDFSARFQGQIFVNEAARNFLMTINSDTERLLIEKLLLSA